MSCVKPLEAWRGSGGAIVFDRKKSTTKVPFQLPCGRCIGCRLEKARQWGMRCMHEKRMHARSCYVTLTYNDEFLPDGGTLVKRDLQLFMKRLRKARQPEKIRFFAGGEYGDTNKRPHYHLLLFGCDFPDVRHHGRNMRGEPLYTSAELAELWFQGFNTIGEVTFDSAVYCAKYALKKVNGEYAWQHYEFIDESGVVYDRQPEFALMSRRPGIGSDYYAKYGNEIRDLDSVVFNGRTVRPPRFYDTRSEAMQEPLSDGALIDNRPLAVHKRERKRLALLNKADNTPERLLVKEKLMQIAADKKERKL